MASLSYHLDEVELALDPSRPEHLLPDLRSCTVGVVDVGCGIGQLFVAKDEDIPKAAARYAVDYDAEAIAYAQARWPHLAQFMQGQAEQVPIPSRSVDWYVSRVALPYTDFRKSIPEAARVLVPGGRLWITLHPARMVWREFLAAVRQARPKSVVTRAMVLLNGASLHLTGRVPGLLGIRESWQSGPAVTQLLEQSGFEDIKVTRTTHHFLVEARRSR